MPASATCIARREPIPPGDPVPQFFGAGASRLFGLHHPAGRSAHAAVLLCPPLGQEAVRTHRAYRLLAEALVNRGCSVLRFDYAGTGDSAGEGTAVTWEHCIGNVAQAANHLRELHAGVRVIAFGARLGATLALSADTAHFSEVIAWDPVLDGAGHVETMDQLHAAMCRDTRRFPVARQLAEADSEWLGFPVDPSMKTALRGLHLGAPTRPVHVFASADADALPTWTALTVHGGSMRVLPEPTAWGELERLEIAIIPHALIQAVATHFGPKPP